MAKKIRPKKPTMSEQIEALTAEIEQLKSEKADLYKRTLTAEQDVMESRPYRALLARYEEMDEFTKGILADNSRLREELRIAKENQISKPSRGRPYKVTPELRDKVLTLRDEKASVRTIARVVGLSVGTVSAIINGK